jgi:hypothetical protein
MIVFFVFRFMILSRRISFPLIVTTTPPPAFTQQSGANQGA